MSAGRILAIIAVALLLPTTLGINATLPAFERPSTIRSAPEESSAVCHALASENSLSEIPRPESKEFLTVTLTFDISVQSLGDYSIIKAKGAGTLRARGKPRVPVKTVTIGLPPDAVNVGVEAYPIEVDEVRLPSPPSPSPPPVARLPDRLAPLWDPKPELEPWDNYYPRQVVKLVETTWFRHYHVAMVTVYPAQVRYDPPSARLYRKLTLVVKYERSGAAFEKVHEWTTFDEVARRVIVNFEDAFQWRARPLQTSSNLPAGEYDYVIITPEEFKPYFEKLATWKEQKGLRVNVTTVEWILSTYSGYDDAEKVRNFIKDAYQTWNIKYVLLGGDCAWVPVRYVYLDDAVDAEYDEIYFPNQDGRYKLTDYYFACLDGTWDADGDHLYGENATGSATGEDEVDWYPEVIVGRLPVNNTEQAQIAVEKTIAADARQLNKRILLIGVNVFYDFYDWGLFDYDSAYDMENCSKWISPQWRRFRLYERSGNASRYSVLRACGVYTDNGTILPTIILHSDHGSCDGLWESRGYRATLLSSDFDQYAFSTSNTFLIWADDCLSGGWDWFELGHGQPYDPNGDNNSIAEHATVYTRGGAFAYIGASRVAYGGWTYGKYAACLMYYTVNETFDNGGNPYGNPPGDALFAAKVDYVSNAYGLSGFDPDETASRKTVLEFNLLGDPEISYGSPSIHQREALVGQGENVYFFINVTSRAGLQWVNASWSSPDYDIDLYVYDPNGDLVAYSDASHTNKERVSFAPAKDGIYKVRIYGYFVQPRGTRIEVMVNATGNFTLYYTQPPSVLIESPSEDSSISGVVTVRAYVNVPPRELSSVKVLDDLSMEYVGNFRWEVTVDVSHLVTGDYRITVQAENKYGAVGSDEVAVHVAGAAVAYEARINALHGEFLIWNFTISSAGSIHSFRVNWTSPDACFEFDAWIYKDGVYFKDAELIWKGRGRYDAVRRFIWLIVEFKSTGWYQLVVWRAGYAAYSGSFELSVASTADLKLQRYQLVDDASYTTQYENQWETVWSHDLAISSDRVVALYANMSVTNYNVPYGESFVLLGWIGLYDPASGEWVFGDYVIPEAGSTLGSVPPGSYTAYFLVYVYGSGWAIIQYDIVLSVR